MPPCEFSVYPAPHSRLHDPTPTEDPCLPQPAPQLYAYDLPELPPRDKQRFAQQSHDEMLDAQPNDAIPPVPGTQEGNTPIPDAPSRDAQILDTTVSGPRPSVAFVSFQPGSNAPRDEKPPSQPMPTLELTGPVSDPASGADQATSSNDSQEDDNDVETSLSGSPTQRLVPLPKSYWESIPKDCLVRMLEFDSVRAEYKRTYGKPPSKDFLDDSPKLALEDIIDLTLLNSRELQTQKEQLFRTALALTLERFDYQLKPSFGNNGTAANYVHNRSDGITDDTLLIPSTLQLEKLLYTGGDFLGRFANDVLLNFNGPQGFTADVSSELLASLSQSLLQRDVRLENLTLAERNVVYAARDFARFRKELFVQQAGDYYSLIRQFRQIEINCQNYFTLAREFNQRSVEIRIGFAAKTQLDQVEQQVINGRQSILSTCTSLENALDSLKIRMGIPTEQPLNLDLSELNLLTLRDELAVNAELIERTRSRIRREMDPQDRSAVELVGSLTPLVEQMLDSIELRERLGEDPPDAEPLKDVLLGLRIEAADIDIAEPKMELERALADENPVATILIQRRRDVVGELLKKIDWQLQLLSRIGDDQQAIETREARVREFAQRMETLEENFLELIQRDDDDDGSMQQKLVGDAERLQDEVESMASTMDREIGRPTPRDEETFQQRAMEFADGLLTESQTFLETSSGGLVPIQIDMDDAMMTALVQRFDLMNQRGFLADDWRQIKYAADDLRSVLNLQASQSIRTRRGENRPFDLSFDDSTTSVGVTLDLPFNRRAQRNRYRASLFDYQSTLRSVMQLEDTIKLSVRRDLRALNLDRQQYGNDVAGAALASERVTGTELEVRGGFATSRDFLESQNAYVQAVSNVASRHISYIVGRLQLFLDLESLTVGANGFWDELYDEEYQPEPFYQLPGYEPAYGCLHPKLKYSPRIQRMRCVPQGTAMIHQPQPQPEATE